MRDLYSYSQIKVTLALSWVLLFSTNIYAQDEVLDGRFLEPTTKVGVPTHYILKMRHSPDLEVLFPDSTYDFSPFELLSKQAFPTKTDSLGSLDSVVYTLATFNTDARQGLSIPVYIADKKQAEGKRPIYPSADSVDLEVLLKTLPDSVAAFENTQMATVKEEFNYPYLLIGLASLLIVLAAVWLLFGNDIRSTFLLRKLKKQHLQFIQQFDQLIFDGGKQEIEPAVSLWKSHAGEMLGVPMGSYTTKEVSRKVKGVPSEVIVALKKSDQAIYAGIEQADMLPHFRLLKDYAQDAYQQRVNQIKNDQVRRKR